MLDKLKINSKLLKQLDYSILIIAVAIVLFGVLNIYSATRMRVGTYYMKLQLMNLIVALIASYICILFDYVMLMNYASVIYWASIAFLIVNDTLGKVSKGARSWIAIGSRAIQPSEFAKLGIIIILAKKLNDMEGDINKPKNFFTLLFYAGLPMFLILIQPDMGMTMVCFFIVLGIVFIAGLDLKVIIGGFTSLIALIAIIWNSPLMQTYWKNRLTSFVNPEADQLNTGYQLMQSQIGIGSGGLLGSGFLNGSQIKGGFIPEPHTDFIFAVVGEEWGLIGTLILLFLFGLLIYKFIKIAKNSKDIFGSILCVGIISSFLFSILQNIGMTIGIMAITGITLPLMSYGGSSLLSTFMAIGFILNVGMRKKKLNF